MDSLQALTILDRILGESRMAILANTDINGEPRVRWMSPARLKGRQDYLYAVSSRDFGKIHELYSDCHVMWMLQTMALDEILNIRGTMKILENPGIVQEVIEAIGPRLGALWKLGGEAGELVVLETRMNVLEYFRPDRGYKESCSL